MYTAIAIGLWVFLRWQTARIATRYQDADRPTYDRARGVAGEPTDDATYLLLLHIRQDMALAVTSLSAIGGGILILIGVIADTRL